MTYTEYLYDWTWSGYNPISCGWQQCPPGHSFGLGIREFYTIHYVLSGSGTYTVKGKEYQIKAGDLFSFSPFETVYYRADDQNPWHYVWLNFIINGNVPYMFEQPVIHAPFLEPIFQQLQAYPRHDTNGREFSTQCLWEIAGKLSCQQTGSLALVENAIGYIQMHYTSPNLSIEEIAEKLNVSRFTLSEAFAREKNISPISYLIQFRLEKACEYMNLKELSPTVAAYSVGYKNYTHFSRIFKKYYGISPKDYQNQVISKSP